MKAERGEVLGVLAAAIGSTLLPEPLASAEQTMAQSASGKEAVRA